jgi:hypothetical protein
LKLDPVARAAQAVKDGEAAAQAAKEPHEFKEAGAASPIGGRKVVGREQGTGPGEAPE